MVGKLSLLLLIKHKSGCMMRWIFTLFFCLGVAVAFGQANNDYRTKASGNWSNIAIWERYTTATSAWVPATVAPTATTPARFITITHDVVMDVNSNNDQAISVSGSVTINPGSTWIIAGTANTTLTIGGTLNILGSLVRDVGSTNASIVVNGTLSQTGLFVNNGTSANVTFNGGANYENLSTSGSALPIATWTTTSNCSIKGATIIAPGLLNQSFGNFTWETASLSSNLNLAGTLTTVKGNLSVLNTNGRTLYLSNGAAYTLNVGFPSGGSFLVGSAARVVLALESAVININGDFTTSSPSLVGAAGTGDIVIDINGNLNIGSGIFNVSSSSGTPSIKIAGNYAKTGTIRSTGGQPLAMTFDGNGVQNFTSTTVPNFPINYVTLGTSNLTVAPTSHLSGSGTLTISSGTSLTVTNTGANGAIRNLTTTGNVRVSGARIYNGTIIYGGTGRQRMYADTPNAPTTISNAAHVELRESVTLASALRLQTGQLRIGAHTLSVGAVTYGTGSFGYNASSSLVFNSPASANLAMIRYAGNGISNLTINSTGTATLVSLPGSSLRVNGTLALTSGTLALNAQTLQLYGPMTVVSGALSAAGGSVYVRGAGSLPNTVPLSGTLALLEVNRAASTLSTTGALTVSRLNLYGGSVLPLSGLQMANGGTIYRTNGSLNAAIGAAGTYNVQYLSFSAPSITTGFEIPNSGTALNLVTINNTTNTSGIVVMDKAMVAGGQIRVWRGQLDTGNFGVATGGNLRVDATGRLYPGTSTFTFNGTGAQSYNTIASAYTPYTLVDVVVNKATGTMSLSTPVNIRNSFAVNSYTTVAAGNNRLTLLSDATSTAYIPTMPAIDGTTRGRITGTVIVQRYLPNGNSTRQYRYLSAPTTNTMVSDWQNEIPISGKFTNPSTGTFDGVKIITANPSMFYYDNATATYVGYPSSGSSTVAPITSGRGYAVYGRTTTTTPLVLDSHGTLGQHNVNVPVTYTGAMGVNAGYNLVGNPYPAPVNWNAVFAASAGIGATIFFTDNNHNAATTGLITYNGSTGVVVPANPAGSFDGNISMGQGFWVSANPGGGTKQVRFREVHKAAGQSKFIRKAEPGNLLRLAMKVGNVTDHLAVMLMDSATSAYDYKYDGLKFEMPGASIATLSSNNERMVINALAKADCNRVVPIDIAKATTGSYTFDFTGLESFDASVKPVLVDKLENKNIDLATAPTYTFSVSDIAKLAGRFELRFDGPALNTQLAVKGETTCFGSTTAIITLPASQSGVQYTALVNGSSMSATIAGNGGELLIPVNVDGLPQGATEVTISAQFSACGAENLAEKATIVLLNKPAIGNVTAEQICGSGTSKLTAAAVEGNLYNWYEGLNDATPIDGQHSSSFTTPVLEKSKTYFVAAVNAAGCEGARMEVKATVLQVAQAAITADGNVLTSNYETGNQWYLDGDLLQGQTGKSIEAAASGVYTLVVNTGTCTSTSEAREMNVLGAESGDSFVRVYPNPAPDKVYVEVRYKSDVAVDLISTTGVQIRSAQLSGSDDLKTASFDINSLPDGMYLVRVKAGTKTFTKKILKAK